MLKKIQVATLLIIIFLAAVFGFLYVSFSQNHKFEFLKPVNESLRPSVIKNFTLRRSFRLVQPGDARSDYYTSKQFTRLKVEVYKSPYGTLLPSSVDLIKTSADGVINKPDGIFIEERGLENVPGKVDDSFIDKLSDDIPRFSKNTAVLRIYILSTYGPHPTLLGITANAHGFIIFKNSIAESSKDQSLQEDLETETILHEIGHLLGAAHSSYDKCIMNKIVDVPGGVGYSYIPTQYCIEDNESIKDANL